MRSPCRIVPTHRSPCRGDGHHVDRLCTHPLAITCCGLQAAPFSNFYPVSTLRAPHGSRPQRGGAGHHHDANNNLMQQPPPSPVLAILLAFV